MIDVEPQWIINSISMQKVDEMMHRYKVGKLVALILANREDLIVNNRIGLHNPFSMKGMDIAVRRINEAIQNNEKIMIYGDYDADGIMATTLLYKFLKSKNVNVDCYIPNRCEEGYGINISAIDKIKAKNVDLIITVDTGSVAFEQVDYANKLGIDVVITDHHECEEKIPNGVTLVNPKRLDCDYPFKNLCGAGVAFKLIEALDGRLHLQDLIQEYSSFVAIGTVADVMPLLGENRTLVKLGLNNFTKVFCPGLKALVRVSGLDLDKIDARSIGHIIAPKINACGRLGNQYESLNLMLSKTDEEALSMVASVVDQNDLRREIEKKIYEEVIHEIELNKYYEQKIIVVESDKWHQGVVGIVASKVCEKYYRPCILISITEKECKGSARSVNEFNIFDAISANRELLQTFGGHSLAAGITIPHENIKLFRKAINDYADSRITKDDLIPKVHVDAKIEFSDINIKSVSELKKLEPYGTKNKLPVFEITKLKIESMSFMTGGDHVKMILRSSKKLKNVSLTALAFRMGPEIGDKFKPGDIVDVVGNLEINNFRDSFNVQLILKDIKFSNV